MVPTAGDRADGLESSSAEGRAWVKREKVDVKNVAGVTLSGGALWTSKNGERMSAA